MNNSTYGGAHNIAPMARTDISHDERYASDIVAIGSGTFVDISTGAAMTPGAGTWKVWAACTLVPDSTGDTAELSVGVDSVSQANSVIHAGADSILALVPGPSCMRTREVYIALNGAQVLTLMARDVDGTCSLTYRSLHAEKISE